MAKGFPYADLPEFLSALERDGDLRRITAPVDPTLEISEITQRVVRDNGPALLFENPTRGEMPVAMNLFGNVDRMAKALGVEHLDEIGARIGELIKPDLPIGWAGIRDGLGKLMQLKSVPPKKVKGAACQDMTEPAECPDRRPRHYRKTPDGLVYAGKAGWSRELAELQAADGREPASGRQPWPEGTTWEDDGNLYRVERMRRGDVLPGNFRHVFTVMETLAAVHKPENVRLVVYFDS